MEGVLGGVEVSVFRRGCGVAKECLLCSNKVMTAPNLLGDRS